MCLVSLSLSVPTFQPTNHSGVLHLCQPISVPRVCQPITDLSCSDQSGSTLGKPSGFCCQASQRANTDGWQKKYRQGSGANTNSGQKKYRRADSNVARFWPPEQTYNSLIKHLLWKFGTIAIKLTLGICLAPLTAIKIMAWTCFMAWGLPTLLSQYMIL